jgi:hypothetical protein
MGFGFTEPCASVWIYNSFNTNQNCPQCAVHALQKYPNNDEAPTCYLADCIQCDEDQSGPLFQKFAGRTRRRSGLLSYIVRNCTTIPSLVHRDPCDDTPLTKPPSAAPTAAPTDDSGVLGGGATKALMWGALSSIVYLVF